jgi:hypothetical protein
MSNEWQGKDRRRFPRISDTIPVAHRVLASLSTTDFVELEQRASRTWTKDFSCGGVCIRTGRRLLPGTILELVIEFPGHPIKAVGKVVWSKELGNPAECHAGVEFIAMDQNQMDEMAQTVAECLIETYKPKERTGASKLKEVLASLFTSLRGSG